MPPVSPDQRRKRIEQVGEELIGRIRKEFPLVQLLEAEDRPAGTVAYHVYVPYEDVFHVFDVTGDRVVELAAHEGLIVMLVPHSRKNLHRAA